jgi:hypothetical protein
MEMVVSMIFWVRQVAVNNTCRIMVRKLKQVYIFFAVTSGIKQTKDVIELRSMKKKHMADHPLLMVMF